MMVALAATALAPALPAATSETDIEFGVDLSSGQPAQGLRTLTVTRGQTVTIAVRSDEPVTLHLHGYDRELTVGTDGRAMLRLEARIAGRFPIETHDSKGQSTLLYLEVHPN